MDFHYFLSLISKIEKAKLGGLASQIKMIPKERDIPSLRDIELSKPRRAAVLALFYPDKNHLTKFLLILRPDYDGTHASQISFPGGKYELEDGSLEITALRETSEEVGITMDRIELLKKMTDTYIPPSNFLVSPYVGFSHDIPKFITNHEVEEIVEVNLADLLSDQTVSSKNLSTSYMQNIEVPCFKLNNRTVWGATAMMLSEIKDLIKDNLH